MQMDPAMVRNMVKNVIVPEFKCKKVVIKTSDKDEAEEKSEDDEEVIKRLTEELPSNLSFFFLYLNLNNCFIYT